MKIACPRCEASYEVEPLLFGVEPRIVQCSACDFRWTERPGRDAAGSSASIPADEAADDRETDSWEVRSEEAWSGDARPREQDAPTSTTSAADGDWEAPPAEEEPSPEADPPSASGYASEDVGSDAGFDEGGAGGEDHADDESSTQEDAQENSRDPTEHGDEEGASKAETRPAPVMAEKRRFALPTSRRFVAGSAAVATTLVSIALLLLLRDPIVSLVPATRGFYASVGLMPDPLGAGLEIREVASLRDREGGEEILTVTGVVANVAHEATPVPEIRVSLFDVNDEELQFVNVAHERPSLDPGETLHFDARITDPRPEARRVRVGFVPEPGY